MTFISQQKGRLEHYYRQNKQLNRCGQIAVTAYWVFGYLLGIPLNFTIGFAVVVLKLSQIQFTDVDIIKSLYGPIYLWGMGKSGHGKAHWSWSNFYAIMVILYQIVNIVPTAKLQRHRLLKFQKELFGPSYWDHKSNLDQCDIEDMDIFTLCFIWRGLISILLRKF